jgi:hypothetical protein
MGLVNQSDYKVDFIDSVAGQGLLCVFMCLCLMLDQQLATVIPAFLLSSELFCPRLASPSMTSATTSTGSWTDAEPSGGHASACVAHMLLQLQQQQVAVALVMAGCAFGTIRELSHCLD